MRLVITGSAVNVRSGPSTAAPVLAQLRRGDEVEELATAPWRLVALPDGREGWVHGAYVAEAPPARSTPLISASPKVPDGESEVRAMFGEPGNPECEAGRVNLPAPLTVSWEPGSTVRRFACHRKVAPHMQAAFDAVYAAGLWGELHDYGGCYALRKVRGGKGYSTHAWGIAVDVDVARNPLGKPPKIHPRIVAIFRVHGFVWGGDFKRPDGMHFQWASGI